MNMKKKSKIILSLLLIICGLFVIYHTQSKKTEEVQAAVDKTGKWGTVDWEFDSSTGVLTFTSGGTIAVDTGANSQLTMAWESSPWNRKKIDGSGYDTNRVPAEAITKIVFTKPVTAPADSQFLFSGLNYSDGDPPYRLLLSDKATRGILGTSLPNLTSIVGLDKLDTSKVTNTWGMFFNASSLVLTESDLLSFNTSQVQTMGNMFRNCASLKTLNLSNFDVSNVTTMESMFDGCSKLTEMDLSSFTNPMVENMQYMFRDCASLEELDLTNFKTPAVTTMYGMFSGCRALLTLDLKSFDTRKVITMAQMFMNCNKLTSVDIAFFNVENVKDFAQMFSGCANLESLDLSNFKTRKATTYKGMFQQCGSLTKIDVSTFITDIDSVKDYSGMFKDCDILEKIDGLNKFKTGIAINFNSMFQGCKKLKEVDLSSFDTKSATSMFQMFENCETLTKIDFPKTFKTATVRGTYRMFYGCKSIRELDLSTFSYEKVFASNTNDQITSKDMLFGMTSLERLTLKNQFPALNSERWPISLPWIHDGPPLNVGSPSAPKYVLNNMTEVTEVTEAELMNVLVKNKFEGASLELKKELVGEDRASKKYGVLTDVEKEKIKTYLLTTDMPNYFNALSVAKKADIVGEANQTKEFAALDTENKEKVKKKFMIMTGYSGRWVKLDANGKQVEKPTLNKNVYKTSETFWNNYRIENAGTYVWEYAGPYHLPAIREHFVLGVEQKDAKGNGTGIWDVETYKASDTEVINGDKEVGEPKYAIRDENVRTKNKEGKEYQAGESYDIVAALTDEDNNKLPYNYVGYGTKDYKKYKVVGALVDTTSGKPSGDWTNYLELGIKGEFELSEENIYDIYYIYTEKPPVEVTKHYVDEDGKPLKGIDNGEVANKVVKVTSGEAWSSPEDILTGNPNLNTKYTPVGYKVANPPTDPDDAGIVKTEGVVSANENKELTIITGKLTADQTANAIDIYYVYKTKENTVTEYYVDEDGNYLDENGELLEVATPVEEPKKVAYGGTHTIKNPVLTGYTAKEIRLEDYKTGTEVKDTTITVKKDLNIYYVFKKSVQTVTLKYVDEAGNALSPNIVDVTESNIIYGTSKNYESVATPAGYKAIGYKEDAKPEGKDDGGIKKDTIANGKIKWSGTIKSDKTIYFVYRKQWTITEKYVLTDGTEISGITQGTTKMIDPVDDKDYVKTVYSDAVTFTALKDYIAEGFLVDQSDPSQGKPSGALKGKVSDTKIIGEIKNVTGNYTIYYVYKRKPVTITEKYVLEDGTEISGKNSTEKIVAYGDTYTQIMETKEDAILKDYVAVEYRLDNPTGPSAGSPTSDTLIKASITNVTEPHTVYYVYKQQYFTFYARQYIRQLNGGIPITPMGYINFKNQDKIGAGAAVSASYQTQINSVTVDNETNTEADYTPVRFRGKVAGKRVIAITPIVPEHYKVVGYLVTADPAQNLSADPAPTLAPTYPEFELSGKTYVTVVLEPIKGKDGVPPIFDWDYKTNDFGKLK